MPLFFIEGDSNGYLHNLFPSGFSIKMNISYKRYHFMKTVPAVTH